MIKGRDIIVHGLQSLDSPIGSNCINIAYEFSKNNRVLYVNYPIDRLTLIRHKNNPLIQKRRNILKGLSSDLVKINDSMWNLYPRTKLESIGNVPGRAIFKMINRINNKRFAAEVLKAIEKLQFKDFIIFNDSDFYRGLYFKELLKPAFAIYYTRDNMRATKYFQKHGAYYEDQLMVKSDLVVSNSIYLNDIALENNKNSVYVGQGCDISLFNSEIDHPKPEDIKIIVKPVIGYIGALKSSRLDIDTLIHIAKAKPEWSVVLVGPEDDVFKSSGLHKLTNVYFLGSKQESELPQYLNMFDVALNPQKLNELTIGNYPRKIDEYLAMGKPVVATKTRAMEVFKDYTYLADSPEEYVKLIEKAIIEEDDDKKNERIRFAKEHTWENNVKAIYKAILDTEK